MPNLTPNLAPILAPILALDVGKARIGIALSDPTQHTAHPLLTLYRQSSGAELRGPDLRNLTRLLRKHQPSLILVGNPLLFSGDPSPWTLKVHALVNDLRTRTVIPIQLWDERLTSVAANEILDATGHSTRDRKHLIDQVAAVIILEDYLTHQQNLAARQL